MTVPAGAVDVIVGAEAARDRYETSSPGIFNIADRRTSSAVYGEVRVPIFRADASAGSAWDLAAFTVAGRRDKYSDFGSASTYQAGLEVRPVRTVLLRVSAASSFKPPTLLETSVDNTSDLSEDYGLVDTARGGEPIVGVEVLRTANPALQPEKGRAFSFGAVWEPDSAAGTRLAVTAWNVKINGLIALLWPQVTIDNEALFPGFINRGPSDNGGPGPITHIITSEVNFGSVNTAGADFEVSHAWRGLGGKWSAAASTTRTTKYEVAIAPGSPAESRLGRRSPDYWAPKWKGRLSLGLNTGNWSLGITSRYVGAYKDVEPSNRDLGGFWIHDLTGSLDLKRLGWAPSAVGAASLSIGMVNAANRLPEFVEQSPYYDASQADWRGRYTSLRLAMTF